MVNDANNERTLGNAAKGLSVYVYIIVHTRKGACSKQALQSRQSGHMWLGNNTLSEC